jgi:hypothetical protein
MPKLLPLLKKLPSILEEIKQKHPDKKLELWCQDESRIGQKGSRTRTWGQKGIRLRSPVDTKYTAVGLILPQVNTEAMQLHLDEVSSQLPEDVHAAMLADGAGWHTAAKLTIPQNITIIKIPPYSPELNPAEKPWQYVKDNSLSNRLFKSYEDILDACQTAWNNLLAEKGRIKSLTNFPYLQSNII